MRAVNETAAVNKTAAVDEGLRASDRTLKQDRISRKKLKKTFKKSLDKIKKMWYNPKADLRGRKPSTADGISRKKLKKLLKILLTNARECDIMSNTSAKKPKGQASGWKPRKKLKKLLKNPLTNKTECDIINGSRKTRHRANQVRTDHWQLNNRRLKYKQKLSAKESRISLKKDALSITDEAHTQKSKRAKQARQTRF